MWAWAGVALWAPTRWGIEARHRWSATCARYAALRERDLTKPPSNGAQTTSDRRHQKAGSVGWGDYFACSCVCRRYNTGMKVHDGREPPVIWEIPDKSLYSK